MFKKIRRNQKLQIQLLKNIHLRSSDTKINLSIKIVLMITNYLRFLSEISQQFELNFYGQHFRQYWNELLRVASRF